MDQLTLEEFINKLSEMCWKSNITIKMPCRDQKEFAERLAEYAIVYYTDEPAAHILVVTPTIAAAIVGGCSGDEYIIDRVWCWERLRD